MGEEGGGVFFFGGFGFNVLFFAGGAFEGPGGGGTSHGSGGGAVWSVGGVHSSGVGILFGSGGVRVEGSFTVMQGRRVGADVSVGASKLRVICVYGPQERLGRGELVAGVAPHLATNRALVVGGDFNFELGGTGEGSAGVWRDLFAGHRLVDGGGRTSPRLDGPTWCNSRGV